MDLNLPINQDAESIILGRMMSSINAANDALEALQDTDFFYPEHQVIFRAMRQLARKEAEIEPMSVFSIWQAESDKADIALLFGLHQHTSSYTDDVTHYIDLVRDASIYRKLIAHSKEIMVMGSSLCDFCAPRV